MSSSAYETRSASDPISPAPVEVRLDRKNKWKLVATEFWERFSYYGLQAVLTFYLLYSLEEGGLNLDPGLAVGIVGAYGAAIFLFQAVGAWLGDRLIPPRLATFIGGVMIMCGHIALALVPGLVGLAIGLISITAGTGILKVNLSLLLGAVYRHQSEEERAAGFSLFWMALNIGSIVGPLLTGITQSSLGFHFAFALAAIGMFIALVQYAWSYRKLPAETAKVANPLHRRDVIKTVIVTVIFAGILAILLATRVITGENLNIAVGIMLVVVSAATFTFILRSRKTPKGDRRRVRSYIILWAAEALFYGFLLQIFTTIPLFVTDRVNRNISGWMIPEGWFPMLAAVSLVIVLWLLGSVWKHSKVAKLPVTSKFTLGLTLIGLSYLAMLLTSLTPGENVVSPFVLAGCLFLVGISEAFVGPIGLSVVVRISPESFKAQTVALKYYAIGLGSTISGAMGLLYIALSETQFFLVSGLLGLLFALLMKLLSRAAAPAAGE